MRNFIVDKKHYYNSFLDCLEHHDFSIEDLNKRAVSSFLKHGVLYDNETFIQEVKKEFTHQKRCLDIEKGFYSKPISDDVILTERKVHNPIEEFLNFFEKRKSFLKEKKISVDLTGGIDSRLIAAILKHFEIPFDTLISKKASDSKEVEIAKEVANQLDVNFDEIIVDDIQNEQELEKLLALGDGMWDALKLTSLYRVQSWRKKKGYELAITGVGGELYKDFWWQQDFPFYLRKKANIKRLLRMRFDQFSFPPDWITPEMKNIADNEGQNLIEKINQYRGSSNTSTYDQVYFHLKIKEQISVLSHASENFLSSYSPFLEQDLVEIGYSLPKRCRFFNRFHRAILTKIAPEVAKIDTTDGRMSVSTDIAYLSKDVLKFAKTKSARLISIKVNRRKGKPSPSPELPLLQFVSAKIQSSVRRLKEAGVFDESVPEDYKRLPNIIWGRILTLGFVLEKLEQ